MTRLAAILLALSLLAPAAAYAGGTPEPDVPEMPCPPEPAPPVPMVAGIDEMPCPPTPMPLPPRPSVA